MLLRLLRQLLRVLIRLGKTTWNNGVKLLLSQFIRRWAFVFRLVRTRLSGEYNMGRTAEREAKKKGSHKGSVSSDVGKAPNFGKISGMTMDNIACSLHPYSFSDQNSSRPVPSTPSSSSDDVHASRRSSSISFTVQPPLSPTRSGEGENAAVGSLGSPRNSIQSLESRTSGNAAAVEPERTLEVPRRLRQPASPGPRPRSRSPGARSSLAHLPAASSTSLQPWPYSFPHPHANRPTSPSPLRPVPSRASIRSQSLVHGPSRPISVHSVAPEPLEIIEPPELTELFNDEEDRVYATHPESMERYTRKVFASKEDCDITLEPLTMSFKAPWEPEGWQPIIHPEGALYFWHQQKRILTEAYLYEPDVLQHLLVHLAKIEAFIDRVGHQYLIGLYDLVLDMTPSERGGYICGYYFVNHKERTVFWLEEYNASELGVWHGVKGVKSKTHLKHEIEAQYWYHCQLYPSTVAVTLGLVTELRDIIMHNLADTMTCPHSTSPLGHDDLNKVLSWVNGLKKNLESSSAGSASLLSRLMFLFARERFLHFFGQPSVRLNREISIHGIVNRRTLLIRLFSPLLFSAPIQQLTALEKTWVDGIMHEPTWKLMISRLNKQWEEFILFATVMLNANVAFLAIQSIDEVPPGTRQPAQIASYLSVVASVGSIVIGLLLIKMNRIRLLDTAPDALRFLQERSSPMLGLETLAILYSLPYALLMWGMAAFLIAFCCMCFENTNPVTRGLVGIACIVAGILVAWCIWMGWDRNIHQQPQELFASGVIATGPAITANAGSAGEKGSVASGGKKGAVKIEVESREQGGGASSPGQHLNQTQNQDQRSHQSGRDHVDVHGSATGSKAVAGTVTGSHNQDEHGRVWGRLGAKWKAMWPEEGLNLGLNLRSKLTRWRNSEDSAATAVAAV